METIIYLIRHAETIDERLGERKLENIEDLSKFMNDKKQEIHQESSLHFLILKLMMEKVQMKQIKE